MTRSTSINNAELRKMSTPIPISVNTWQMRSPHQFLNTEDSNQFDPGIMEQTGISQSSVSPSSAASYSFSPIAYINNSTNTNPNSTTGDTNLINNNQQHLHPNNLNPQQHQQEATNSSNIYINQPSQQQYQQHPTSNLTLNNINQPQLQQQQQEPTMNVLNNPNNNLMVNQQTLNHFGYDSNNYPSVADLGHSDLFGADEEHTYSQLIADNDLFVGAGIYEDTHSSNVPLPVDLESLLINATLSDNSSQNMLIASPMPAIDAQINSQHNHGHNSHDDTSDEQSVSNNINPMFLFSKASNLQQNQQHQHHHHQQQQQQQFINQSSDNKSSPFLSQQQSSTFNQANRVVSKEEQEDGFNLDQVHQSQYFNTGTGQQGTIALSLPANSYLAQNYYARPSRTNPDGMNMNQQTGNSSNYNINSTNTSHSNSRSINQLLSNNINRKINYSNQNQMADPVLTQAQLNRSKQQQQQNNNKAQVNQFNSSTDSNSPSNRTSPTNSGNSNNRKISFLLSQQNQQQLQQQQQQQQMNMMSNNSHNFAQQQQQAMSVPGNMYYLQQQIKQEPQQPTDDDNYKFSKLKLSSPGSASTSSSSSSTASSSSSSANQRSNTNNSTTHLITSNSVTTDLDNIINSTGLFNNEDVMSVLCNNNNNNPTSAGNNNNNNANKASDQDIFFKNITSLDACNELNLPSDDQTVVEECLKFASDLEAESLSRQQGRVRRRATVSFSKDAGDEEDEDEYEDDYEDDDYEEEEEDEEEDQANTPLQFGNAGNVDGQAMGIAINRRQRSSRSFSGTSSKLSKSFSAQQNVTKRRQMNINQLCVGSVGSSSHLYNMMQQQQRGQMNSRKHARTSALSLSTSGVDVHSQSVGGGNVQQMTSSNSKDMFSNIQFAPFSDNTRQQQQQQAFQMSPQQNPHNITSSSNTSQAFLSSSLPVTTNFDSMMMVINNKDNNNNQANTNNHPNLNKLLLNSSQQQAASNLPVFSSSFGASTGSKLIPASVGNKLSKKGTTTKQKLSGSLGMLQTKKRQQRKQELFDDSDDDEDEDEDEEDLSEDELTVGSRIPRRAKKISDLDEEEDESTEEEDDDSNDALNTTRSSVASSAHTISQSASSSFVNSESLFDLMMSSKSRDAYFWQYNVQSKGPKTKKVLTLRNKDPHLHRDFFDPVFQLQSLNARGGTAVNKLRKGDGNDVTPNPVKLYNLGNQIRDFIQKSFQMNNACFSPPPPSVSSSSLNQLASTPVGSLGSNAVGFLSSSVDTAVPKEKVNLKREKNKIASRACRLKKKAQHEANKIKLFGLNDEHKQLLDSISSARELIRTKLMEPHKFSGDKKMIDLMDDQINQKYKTKLAGNSDGYVHMLMLQVEKDRANNRKSGILDLKNLNKQYTLFQQHEKQVLQQQQQQLQGQQQIKVEQQSYDDQVGMDESTGGFMFNENTLSPQTPLQF